MQRWIRRSIPCLQWSKPRGVLGSANERKVKHSATESLRSKLTSTQSVLAPRSIFGIPVQSSILVPWGKRCCAKGWQFRESINQPETRRRWLNKSKLSECYLLVSALHLVAAPLNAILNTNFRKHSRQVCAVLSEFQMSQAQWFVFISVRNLNIERERRAGRSERVISRVLTPLITRGVNIPYCHSPNNNSFDLTFYLFASLFGGF